jgi:hypothetical protein
VTRREKRRSSAAEASTGRGSARAEFVDESDVFIGAAGAAYDPMGLMWQAMPNQID